MRKLVESSRYWEVVVNVGNDWGEPSYTETRKYDTREELNEALEYVDYYTYVESVKEVIEYESIYNYID